MKISARAANGTIPWNTSSPPSGFRCARPAASRSAPLVNLFGEQVDSQLMTRTTEEVSKADLLLLLGTTLESEVYRHYINYFEGRRLAIIHQSEHYKDHLADLVIVDQPQNVLPELVKLYNAER